MPEGPIIAVSIVIIVLQCALVALFLYLIARLVTALKMRHRARRDRNK